jgi:alkanesulfonate monooxygenase SsuD/methylene tetrahydromethanopterin reductase-like flavin-dependent oxidoreductase (luciferase family)
LQEAIKTYRTYFQPSAQLQKPYAVFGVNVVAADTDEEAQYLFTTLQQHYTRARRNTRGQLPPPIADMDSFWEPHEKAGVMHTLRCSVVGSPKTIRRGFQELLEKTNADEIIVTGQIYDHQARLRSFQIAGEVIRNLEPDFPGEDD